MRNVEKSRSSIQLVNFSAAMYPSRSSMMQTKMVVKGAEMLQFFDDDYYAQNEFISTPFSLGKKKVVMLVMVTGQQVVNHRKVLNIILRVWYADTGESIMLFRNEARDIVLKSASIKGNINDDVFIFCGNGVTAAIYKRAHILSKTPNFDSKTILFVH